MAFGKKRVGRLGKTCDFDAHSNILSAPVVADIDADGVKEIVFGTRQGKLFCLGSQAELKWAFDTTEKISEAEMMFLDADAARSIESPPSLADIDGDGKQELVFGTEMGTVYAIRCDGKPLWKFKAGGPVRGQVLIHDLGERTHSIIFGSEDGKLYSLTNKGKLQWTHEADTPIQSTPCVMLKEKPIIVFGCDDGNIICINHQGSLIWKYKTEGKIFAQPTPCKLAGDFRHFVVVGSSDNHLYAIDDKGSLYWKYKTEGAILSKATVTDINDDKKPEVVFGSCDNRVYALSCDGDKIWSYETDFWVLTEPIIEDIDGDGCFEIVVGSYDHNLYVLDAEGSYILDYLPGLSGIVQQAGHYSDIITKEPGKITGKKIWQFKTDGVIVGCAYLSDKKSLVVSTKPGKLNVIAHTPD